EFAAEFRNRFIAPKAAVGRQIYERARDRGELRDDVDIDLLSTALPGI
ncbi:TetR-like C-terminal domain-containing protein, partial [Nocardioides sp. GCM10030258]